MLCFVQKFPFPATFFSSLISIYPLLKKGVSRGILNQNEEKEKIWGERHGNWI